jgi:hypothetical protein
MTAKKTARKKRRKYGGSKINFEKLVLAAYHVIAGDSPAVIAERTGVTDRQVRNWKRHAMWPQAIAEAEKRWFPETKHAAMATIGRSIRKGNVAVAQWFAERQIEQLAPPKVRNEHTGADGKPIEHKHAVSVNVYIPENGRGS